MIDPSAPANQLRQSPFGPGTPGVADTPPAPESAPVGQSIRPCGDGAAPEPIEEVRIRISLFFDGTLNNRENVLEGPAGADKGDSYAAGLSNIALLAYTSVPKPPPDCDHHATVYTEGIGTVTLGKDNAIGFAFGMGDTGVKGKVDIGIEQAVEQIKGLAGKKILKHVHVDAFGFSRGAAAARLCVWKCLHESGKTLANRLAGKGVPPGAVKVKFVGLYDTVASFGLVHRNDTADLHLDAIASAERVVQFAAAEEYRENFRLTNIKSKGADEYFLPGVHSDVGGGYADGESEKDWPLLAIAASPETMDAGKKLVARDRQWLIDSGWYRAEELKLTYAGILANRGPIPNTYTWIPLRLMAEQARTGGVGFEQAMDLQYRVPPGVLSQAESEIRKSIGDGSAKKASRWLKGDPAGDADWHKALRHDYLHFSARYGTTMGAHSPQWSAAGLWGGGRRERKVQDG